MVVSNLESFQLITTQLKTPQLKTFQLDDFSNYTWVDNYYQNNNISRIDSQSLTFKDKLSLYKKTTTDRVAGTVYFTGKSVSIGSYRVWIPDSGTKYGTHPNEIKAQVGTIFHSKPGSLFI